MTMRPVYSKDIPLLPVSKPFISHKYHVSWGTSNGVVGVCVSINETNKTVILVTPRTRKAFKNPVKWEDLRHTRKAQHSIESGNPNL